MFPHTAALHSSRCDSTLLSLFFIVNARQVDFENCSHSGLAINPDVPATLFHNTVDSRQSQASSFADVFSCEEGFEDPCLSLLVHAAAGVANRQHHVLAWLYGNVFQRSVIIKSDVCCFNRDFAAARHGITGVYDQVYNYLFDLTRIRLDASEIRFKSCRELDVFTNKTRQHLMHVFYDIIQIEDLRLEDLFATERQQLSN